MARDSWIESKYQALVQEVNTSSPQREPYYMQILKTCELDDATALEPRRGDFHCVEPLPAPALQALDPNSLCLSSLRRQVTALLVLLTPNPQSPAIPFPVTNNPFSLSPPAQPTVHLALIPGTQDQLRRLVCHVTGFYPRDIEVIWERGGQVAQGEQLTSGILPNGDQTFQIQVSIELGQEGVGSPEHACVVRHSSLGHDPLRVTWNSQVTGWASVPVIIAGCILTALVVGALGWYLRRRQGAKKGQYHPAQTQPGTLDSAPATAKPAGNSPSPASSCPASTE
ncbi:SLA class II histocompatibility antigen, DQ haplotype C beta chain-like [Pangshura tecta]